MVDTPKDAWNDELAEQLVGKVLLVGLTFVEASGNRTEQLHGNVVSATRQNGIVLRLAGARNGELYRLAADLRGVFSAKPGAYRLKTTGEIVTDPDFTATWAISPARK